MNEYVAWGDGRIIDVVCAHFREREKVGFTEGIMTDVQLILEIKE